jgi:hypothetical protein
MATAGIRVTGDGARQRRGLSSLHEHSASGLLSVLRSSFREISRFPWWCVKYHDLVSRNFAMLDNVGVKCLLIKHLR